MWQTGSNFTKMVACFYVGTQKAQAIVSEWVRNSMTKNYVLPYVWFMSYLKCSNWCRIVNIINQISKDKKIIVVNS